MPPIEWIEPYEAALQLQNKWNIPHEAAQDIVRGALLGAKCFVRGRRPGETGLRDISREISKEFGSTFPPALLFSHEFIDVEIDWDGLLEYGRLLVPSAYELVVQEADKSRSKKPRYAKRDANYEQKVTDYLIGKLKLNRSMKLKDAWQMCLEKFPKLSSDRAFERRVWKNAKAAIQKKAADDLSSYVNKT
jgi:hypothetical protein